MTQVEDDILAHFGVKGMRWGHRKAETPRQKSFRAAAKKRGKIKRGATKANVALDAGSKAIGEGQKKLIFLPHAYRVKAAGITQSRVLGEARKINKDPKFKGKDLKKKPALKAEYHKEVEKAAKKIYEEELAAVRTEATIDFINAAISPRGDRMNFSAPSNRIRHAESDEVLLSLSLERDELDHIVSMKVVEDEMKQTDSAEEFLAHYGVQGMKWGVRRSAAERAAPSSIKETNKPSVRGSQVIKVKAKAGRGVVATKGGKRNVASKEAVQAAAVRQKAKASTTDALSNKEMKDTIQRMNLEQQFKKLAAEQAKQDRGKRFVQALLGLKVNVVIKEAARTTTTTATQIPRKAIGG